MHASLSAAIRASALVIALSAPLGAQTPAGPGQSTSGQASTQGLAMQAARARMMTARGAKIAYTRKFDLSELPHYVPRQIVSGTIRMWGSNYIVNGFLGRYWQSEFHKFQPRVKLEFHMKTTLAAVPSLVFGVADLGIGRKITFSELELFQRYFDRDPIEIDIATGSYDVPGWNPGYGVVVHHDNPLRRVTLKQLDGIFGAERTGGWEGTSWHPERARGPEQNIRTWGQLGLTGEWADKPIHVYGLNLRYHQTTELSDRLLGGSDKWNEHLRIYANYVSPAGRLERSLNEDLARDRYGMAVIAAPTRSIGDDAPRSNLKILEVASDDRGPFVPYTLETLHERSYPLYDHIFAYADRVAGKAMDPKVCEFLRFVLSREGQNEIMRDGKYLPLTAAVVAAQRRKLDDAAR
jgi:phosphate transport system substrate-binding protein